MGPMHFIIKVKHIHTHEDHLGINLNKVENDLNSKIYNTLMEKFEEAHINGIISWVYGLEELMLLKYQYPSPSIYRFNAILNNIRMAFSKKKKKRKIFGTTKDSE